MAVLDNMPPSLAELLGSPPEPGQRNVWLFTAAVRARHVASAEKIRRFLRSVAAPWRDRDFAPEIDRAVARAFAATPPTDSGTPIAGASASPPWPPFNPTAWQRRLALASAFPLEPIAITAEQVIDALFPGNPLLCLALDTRSAHTQPRESWRGMEAGMQFIVSNAMRAPTGTNRSGNTSTRCHDNATPSRCYQVIEFDRGSLAEQATILASLDAPLARLVLVVWSGGKSLHAWFRVGGLSDYAKLRFFRHAVYLGADATLWDPAKLVRMPGGRRATGEIQHVCYFHPGPFHS